MSSRLSASGTVRDPISRAASANLNSRKKRHERHEGYGRAATAEGCSLFMAGTSAGNLTLGQQVAPPRRLQQTEYLTGN
jgi:hypothetical protein